MVRLRDVLPVEPLSERRWEQIQEAVMVRLAADGAERLGHAGREALDKRPASFPRTARTWYALVVATGLGVAVSLLIAGIGEREIPSLADVVTGPQSTRLDWGGAVVEIAPASDVSLRSDRLGRGGATITLRSGRVMCDVAPRPAKSTFVVRAGDVRVEVLGTRFVVSRTSGDVGVEVLRGTVRVVTPDEMVTVGAGETWGTAPRPVPVPAKENRPDQAVHPHVSTPNIRPGLDPKARRRPGAGEAPHREAIGRSEASQDPFQRTDSQSESGARVRYEMAAQLEARDPEAAVDIYRELAAGRDLWAGNALFAHGRLQADRKRVDEARRLLAEYLRRFPAGPNAEDARALLAKISRNQ